MSSNRSYGGELHLCWCGKVAVTWEVAIVDRHWLCEDHCTQREVRTIRQAQFGPSTALELDTTHFTHVEISDDKGK